MREASHLQKQGLYSEQPEEKAVMLYAPGHTMDVGREPSADAQGQQGPGP